MTKLLTFAAIVAALTVSAAPAFAQGWIDATPGTHGVPTVARTRSDVRVRVSQRIAYIEVEEWFENRGHRPAEGDYLYPLPNEAIFSNVSLFMGDQELTGEMIDADHARSIYEEIVRQNRDPALIELVGNGLIRARVFPIAAGESRKVTLRFTQMLDRSGDALRFQYVAGVRNVGGNSTSGRNDNAPIAFQLETNEEERFGDPFSPTHTLDITRSSNRLTVRPETTDLSGKLTIFLPLSSELVGITVATHRPIGSEAGYFMLTLTPDNRSTERMSRDLTAVVDVSGSMSGSKLDQAQAALRQLLQSLNPEDRFRLIAFSNSVSAHSNRWMHATDANIAAARDWVDNLRADGGTHIDAALSEAFRLSSPENRFSVVLFLTDGLPSVGEQDPERIAQRAAADRGNTRVFAFGIGYDVNTYLLDRLSAEGHGATEYVAPGESVERALGTVAAKISHPVLTDIRLSDTPVRFSEIYPVTIADLFTGEELVIFGRYEGDTENEEPIAIAGRRAGRTENFAARATFPEHQLSNDFIPRLWAARKLGFLARTAKLEGRTEEMIREIRETALRYGLLSEYTSYLVQEPEMVAADLARPRRQFDGDRPMPQTVGAAVRFDQIVAASGSTGRNAVEASKRAQEQIKVSNAAELDALNDVTDTRDEFGTLRRVAGRSFVLRDGTWTDLAHTEGLPVVEIAQFSDAYFRLLRMAPELEPWLSQFERILLGGSKISIRITGDAMDNPSEHELDQLVRGFRG